MCGIAGYFNKDGSQPIDRSVLEKMITPLHHRGPDGYGFYTGKRAGFAHARLSIIDLEGGWQPLTNEDRSLWIVFNGEIFNYPELRAELIKKGHTFSTDSDTEVIIHLYEDKGWRCLEDLNGQFAIAIYSTKNETLFLARDRMGIRPLFYTLHNGSFYFASEIKSLFNANQDIPREYNNQVLRDIFTFWSPTNQETCFSSVYQLLPGHWLEIGPKGPLKQQQYWEVPLTPDQHGLRTEMDYAEELRELLISAVQLRLRADVPVGAYLSGGLDSSAITSLIKNYTDNPLKTFSVSFTDEVYDESLEQNVMVKYTGTNHHSVSCSYEDIAKIFPSILWHTECPILRTAPAPLYMLSSLVRQHDYKVVLTGEGADEILGGYDLFKEAKIRAFINRNVDSSIRAQLLKRLYPYLALSPTKSAQYARIFFDTTASIDDIFYAHRPRWKTTARTHLFFRDEVLKGDKSFEPRFEHMIGSMVGMDYFLRAQFVESKVLLSNYLLSSQGDRMGMAHSVEGRFPFLDHRVVELSGRIPANFKMKVLNEKNILKKAVRDILPESIYKRKKQPYMAPDILSFFGDMEPEYLRHYLSPKMLEAAGIFKPKAVHQLMEKCRRKNRQGFRENMAFTGILSTQVIYDTFIKNFSCTPPPKKIVARVDERQL